MVRLPIKSRVAERVLWHLLVIDPAKSSTPLKLRNVLLLILPANDSVDASSMVINEVVASEPINDKTPTNDLPVRFATSPIKLKSAEKDLYDRFMVVPTNEQVALKFLDVLLETDPAKLRVDSSRRTISSLVDSDPIKDSVPLRDFPVRFAMLPIKLMVPARLRLVRLVAVPINEQAAVRFLDVLLVIAPANPNAD